MIVGDRDLHRSGELAHRNAYVAVVDAGLSDVRADYRRGPGVDVGVRVTTGGRIGVLSPPGARLASGKGWRLAG